MDTLSLVSEYLKDLKECMDDGDSKVAKEAKLFDALEHKSVVIEVDNKKIVIFTKAPLRAFGEPFMRYSIPCKVDGQGAWDAELDLADSENYVTKEVLGNMGFVRVNFCDYGRKMVNDVNVEIHGVKFKADFVVLDYVNEGEPSIMFGRDFLVTTKSQVDCGWERALSIDNEIYPEWVLEFFSTLYFDKDMDRTNLMKEKCIWFQLCGHEHILTLPEFAVVLEVDDKHFDYKDYWTRVGKPTLTNHKEVLMEEPLMRIVHKVIVGSLVHRVASRERCQKRDLWMINALEESCGVNLAWIIADHLYKHASRTKENSVICAGHYVTKIASFLGYCVDDEIK
ncbi:hypothetical protein Tco_1471369, partial [Tanacetum coccineum]